MQLHRSLAASVLASASSCDQRRPYAARFGPAGWGQRPSAPILFLDGKESKPHPLTALPAGSGVDQSQDICGMPSNSPLVGLVELAGQRECPTVRLILGCKTVRFMATARDSAC